MATSPARSTTAQQRSSTPFAANHFAEPARQLPNGARQPGGAPFPLPSSWSWRHGAIGLWIVERFFGIGFGRRRRYDYYDDQTTDTSSSSSSADSSSSSSSSSSSL